jgi:hypothetical protein
MHEFAPGDPLLTSFHLPCSPFNPVAGREMSLKSLASEAFQRTITRTILGPMPDLRLPWVDGLRGRWGHLQFFEGHSAGTAFLTQSRVERGRGGMERADAKSAHGNLPPEALAGLPGGRS